MEARRRLNILLSEVEKLSYQRIKAAKVRPAFRFFCKERPQLFRRAHGRTVRMLQTVFPTHHHPINVYLIQVVRKGLRANSVPGYPLTKVAFPRILDKEEVTGSSPVPPTIRRVTAHGPPGKT